MNAQDSQGEQDYTAFTRWLEAAGYNPDPDMLCDSGLMRRAFMGGMQAVRSVATTAGLQQAPSVPTPGHIAYEAMHASMRARDPKHLHIGWRHIDEEMGWDGLNRVDMESAAHAVVRATPLYAELATQLADAIRQRDDARAERDRLRELLNEARIADVPFSDDPDGILRDAAQMDADFAGDDQ